ncbi:MAG: hypothetical protein GX629_11080, partial [Phycisphaerae bacterium]|nr:hypothetical protein [Phycisphaerae bacterium]
MQKVKMTVLGLCVLGLIGFSSEAFAGGGAPLVTTSAVSNIQALTATGNGNITDLDGENVTAYGVCWNTTGSPTISDSKTNEGAASATGPFTTEMSGLSANTTYYVRAYATNTSGTGYGDEVSFTTLALLPTVTTTSAVLNGSTEFDAGGTVASEGMSVVTARGVCWNTTGSPTINDSKTTDGTGTGAFTSSVTGLTKGVTYYYRAYAT